MSELLRRREGPLVIIWICFLIIMSEYFLVVPTIDAMGSELLSWASILASFMMVKGLYHVMMQVYSKTRERASEWWIHLLTPVAFVITFISAVIPPFGLTPIYIWIVNSLQGPMSSTINGLTGLFIVAGAFRAFRLRNKEVTLMLIPAVIIMLTNAPIGNIISDGAIGALGSWIMKVPNTAGFRGIIIGASLGLSGLVARTLTGKERGLG